MWRLGGMTVNRFKTRPKQPRDVSLSRKTLSRLASKNDRVNLTSSRRKHREYGKRALPKPGRLASCHAASRVLTSLPPTPSETKTSFCSATIRPTEVSFMAMRAAPVMAVVRRLSAPSLSRCVCRMRLCPLFRLGWVPLLVARPWVRPNCQERTFDLFSLRPWRGRAV